MWIDLEEERWTFILDPKDSIFHTAPPDDSEGQIRFPVERRQGPLFIESMLFWIPGGPYRAWLLPLGSDMYRLGELKDGRVYDIEMDIMLETVRGPSGKVLGFDMRWVDYSLLAEIRRR